MAAFMREYGGGSPASRAGTLADSTVPVTHPWTTGTQTGRCTSRHRGGVKDDNVLLLMGEGGRRPGVLSVRSRAALVRPGQVGIDAQLNEPFSRKRLSRTASLALGAAATST